MKLIEGQIYVTIEELESYGFSKAFIWKVTSEYRNGQRPSYANIPDPEDKRKCLISYDSIPAVSKLEKSIPSKTDMVAQGMIKDRLVMDVEVMDFFTVTAVTFSKARQYQRVTAYLMLAAPVTVSTAREMGFPNVDGYYTTVMDLMLKEKFDIWHISNLDRFKRRLSPFKKYVKTPTQSHFKAALSSLISKKFGRKNAAKVLSDNAQAKQMQGVMVKIYADPRKFTLQDAYTTYLRFATKKYQEYKDSNGKAGWDEKCFVTEQTMANFLYEPAVQQAWYAYRHGEAEWRNRYEMVTKRLPASYANAKWVIDGTPLHRYFQDGDSAFNRVHVFFVMDECTWCILGVGVSLNGESSGQVLQALRAAAQNAGAFMGDERLYIPFEVQSDNSSANQSYAVQSAFQEIGAVHRPARVGNSRSKVVEPLNKHFFARWMRFREGFTGSMGMSTKIDNKINQERLTEIVKKKQLPDLNTTLLQLQEDVNNWNNDRTWKNADVAEEDRKSPLEKYRKSVAATQEKQKTISEGLSVRAFYWMPTKAKQVKDESNSSRKSKTIHIPQQYKYSNNGIKVDRISPMDGKRITMEFDVPVPGFNADNVGKLFSLRIEPLNYDHAYLFVDDKPVTDEEGNWIKAINKEMFHSAVADHTEGEMKKVMEHQDKKKDQKLLTKSRFETFDMEALTSGIGKGDIINPRLFGQKEVTDALKIAASEKLVNGSKYHLEEPLEVEEEVPVKKPTIKRY